MTLFEYGENSLDEYKELNDIKIKQTNNFLPKIVIVKLMCRQKEFEPRF